MVKIQDKWNDTPIFVVPLQFQVQCFGFHLQISSEQSDNTLSSVIFFIDFSHKILNVISKTKSTQESFQSLVNFDYCDQSINQSSNH